MKYRFCGIFMSLLAFNSCKKEPIFQLPPAQNFTSWLEFKDTIWNGVMEMGVQKVRVKTVSNFTVLSGGFDTSVSVKFTMDNNQMGVEQVVIKYRRSAVKSSGVFGSESIENIYLESNTHIYVGSELSIDTVSFRTKSISESKFELIDFTLGFKSVSTTKPVINLNLNSGKIQVENTFFHIFKKGKVESIDRELYNVDLKGGNEYSPRPLLDFRHDLSAPNDFVLMNVPTDVLTQEKSVDVFRNLQLSKKGKFYTAVSGDIQVGMFYYKYGFGFKGLNWSFTDSSTMSSLLKIDSMELQFFGMPF